MKIKVNDCIEFGKYNNLQGVCPLCHEKMKGRVIVKIMGVGDSRGILIHYDCAFGWKEKEIDYSIFKNLITSNRYGCSYCGKINPNKELKNIGAIYMHPKCCDLFEKKLTKLFDENKEELMLSML